MSTQGTVDKVVVVLKDKDNVALERFVFSLQNMIQAEAYNKDDRFRFCMVAVYIHLNITCYRVEDAMTIGSLSQYFRSFLVKLSMIESQLGQLCLDGQCQCQWCFP